MGNKLYEIATDKDIQIALSGHGVSMPDDWIKSTGRHGWTCWLRPYTPSPNIPQEAGSVKLYSKLLDLIDRYRKMDGQTSLGNHLENEIKEWQESDESAPASQEKGEVSIQTDDELRKVLFECFDVTFITPAELETFLQFATAYGEKKAREAVALPSGKGEASSEQGVEGEDK